MKKIFLIAVSALALAACDNNEDNPATSPVAAKITATIGESTVTRAIDQKWSDGDQIGISSIVGTEQGPFINLKYTITDVKEGKFDGKPLFFYKPMTLIAYYPFTDEEGKVPGSNGIIEATTSAENQKVANQQKIDFLWDSKTGVDKKDFSASDPNVKFVFSHKMSKVTFTFLSSEAVVLDGITIAGPVNVSDMVNYTINGLVLEGTFNTNNGACAVKNDAEADELDISVNDVKDNIPVRPLILFPQTLKDGKAVLDIYTNEIKSNTDPKLYQHYKCNLMFSNGEILPGCNYNYTIKVTKTGLIVGGMTVERWEESDKYLIATVDGEDVFKKQE